MSEWMFRSTSREKDNVEVILIQSDHLPLQHLDQMKNANSRLMRWAMQLQPYAFVFKAIPGKENVGADFLSRL